MPCYTTQTCSVNLDKANVDLLHKALAKEGWTVYHSAGSKAITFTKGGVSGSYRNNKLSFSYSSEKPDTDAIKRAYSKEVILMKAEEYIEQGFELEQDGEDFTLSKNPGWGTVYA